MFPAKSSAYSQSYYESPLKGCILHDPVPLVLTGGHQNVQNELTYWKSCIYQQIWELLKDTGVKGEILHWIKILQVNIWRKDVL